MIIIRNASHEKQCLKIELRSDLVVSLVCNFIFQRISEAIYNKVKAQYSHINLIFLSIIFVKNLERLHWLNWHNCTIKPLALLCLLFWFCPNQPGSFYPY